MNRVSRRAGHVAAALVAGMTLLGGAAASAVAAPSSAATPRGTTSHVRVSKGSVDFLFAADGLPSGAKLDASSVRVTVGNTTLHSSAVPVTSGGPAPIREVMLALDVSGSMAGDGIAAARQAAMRYAASLPSDVRVGLLTFANIPQVRVAPTTDRHALDTALAHVKAGGNTALYDGIIAAVQALHAAPAGAERRLLVLSDGSDTESTKTIAAALAALTSQHIAADVVAFRLPGNVSALNRIASASHGRVLPAADAAHLADAFSAAADAFVPQLQIHVVVPPELTGKQQNLQVSVLAAGTRVNAQLPVSLPAAPSPAAPAASQVVTKPASESALWITLGIVFLALLAGLLVALFVPGVRRERARRAARLDEVNRYRVVSAIDAVRAAGAAEHAASAATPTALTDHVLSLVDRGVRAGGRRERVLAELDRAGMRMRPEEWVALQAVAVVLVAALVGLLTGSVWGGIAGALAGAVAPRIYVNVRIRRRATAFAGQLPETLQLLASSLRSGFSLSQGLDSVAAEASEPTASEFARALTEVRLGADLEDALDDVADRMRCQDLHWVVMAVRISKEVGGNLAEVLMTTVATMRERAEVRGQIKVLSAEGRISAKILLGLPFVVGGAMAVIRPGYFVPMLHSGMGLAMLATGAVLLALGTVWVNRLVKIEV